MNERILLVDDDPNILSAFKRQLRKRYDLDVAEGGQCAIDKVDQNEPYAIVVSDMQMPEVDGLSLLRHVRDQSPDTVRIMLTGNADQKTATDAVNEGRIFRFINKPCSSDDLAEVLTAGLEHCRLLAAEKELLSETLNGSIDLMTSMLSMVNPIAFGRANRVRSIVGRMCPILKLANSWQIEIAAALSQIGSVTIPSDVLEKSYSGAQLSVEDQRMIDEHPAVAAKMVAEIPRLQDVGKIITLAATESRGETDSLEKSIIEASEILDMVLTYDSFACVQSPAEAISQTGKTPRFEGRSEWLKVLSQVVAEDFVVSTVPIFQLKPGMILDEDLRADAGVLLVTKGQQLNDSLIDRLKNYANHKGIQETVRVRVPGK